ncbi:MAG: hypothetical protein V4710_23235 [Verrucomicrobiota bacterium]
MKTVCLGSHARGLIAASFWTMSALGAHAQFSEKWLQDETYWGDGKAEFNVYEAQAVRYGQPRPSEVIHILVREPFSRRELVKTEPNSPAESYPVLKLNQILHIPTGVYVYQQMHSAFWQTSDGALVKATLTSNDSCGNTYKEFRALSGFDTLAGNGWLYEWRTYWEGMASGEERIRAPKHAFFYDELPMRVRTIDFSEGKGGFDVRLAPTVIRSKKEKVIFEFAHVTWITEGETIRVAVKVMTKEGEQRDELLLDAAPPYLLREWKQRDGSHLKLKQSVKIDYWNYNKPGDKERALGDEAAAQP